MTDEPQEEKRETYAHIVSDSWYRQYLVRVTRDLSDQIIEEDLAKIASYSIFNKYHRDSTLSDKEADGAANDEFYNREGR